MKLENLKSNTCRETRSFGWHKSEKDNFEIMYRTLELDINFSLFF